MNRKEYPFTYQKERQLFGILLAGRKLDSTRSQRQLAQSVTETLIQRVYPVVEIEARKYYSRLAKCGMSGQDAAREIVNAGAKGAGLAVAKWRPARSYKFPDFASAFIRSEIIKVYQRIRGFRG